MQMVRLPWPPKELSPNSRAHWRRRHAASKSMRTSAHILCLEAKLRAPDDGDIVLRLTLHPPRIVYDLPAGGRRLVQEADGYLATVQSGAVTFEDGVHTGALPGTLVRGRQPPSAG